MSYIIERRLALERVTRCTNRECAAHKINMPYCQLVAGVNIIGAARARVALAHGVNGRMMLVSRHVNPVRLRTRRMALSALMFSRMVNWLGLS